MHGYLCWQPIVTAGNRAVAIDPIAYGCSPGVAIGTVASGGRTSEAVVEGTVTPLQEQQEQVPQELSKMSLNVVLWGVS